MPPRSDSVIEGGLYGIDSTTRHTVYIWPILAGVGNVDTVIDTPPPPVIGIVGFIFSKNHSQIHPIQNRVKDSPFIDLLFNELDILSTDWTSCLSISVFQPILFTSPATDWTQDRI